MDVPGNEPAGTVSPSQNGPTGLKVGVIGAVTTTVNVVVEAHCPAFGVKV